ncbi:hypothetical protein [Comamonas sp.]|uniref:hypothetical protein n=1 Tax=Comamonas sp. TaxID=34028 RepID=UPI0028B0A9CA|nr:hypothetical protein [Comamonas sp.]
MPHALIERCGPALGFQTTAHRPLGALPASASAPHAQATLQRCSHRAAALQGQPPPHGGIQPVWTATMDRSATAIIPAWVCR